jgi:hypothetical protein
VVGIIISVAIIYSPLDVLFDFEHLSPMILAAIAAILVAYFAMAEAAKRVFFKRYDV